jgi:hypothetical protein
VKPAALLAGALLFVGAAATQLHGIVEVLESPEGAGGVTTCGAVVMDQCIEP